MGKKHRINENKKMEKLEELREKWEELEKLKEKKRGSLLASIYLGGGIAFSVIVTMIPAISNEGLRFVAGMIRSVSGVLLLGLGMSVYNYINNYYKLKVEILISTIIFFRFIN